MRDGDGGPQVRPISVPKCSARDGGLGDASILYYINKRDDYISDFFV